MADESRLVGREDDLDDHNYQVREVYAQYGLTSYKSQVLEKGVVNLLTLQANVHTADATQQTFDLHFEKFQAYTLGRLLTSVEATFPDELETIAALRAALPLRNYIAHNYFWDRASSFMSFSGREAMLAEVIEMRDAFAAADELVEALVRRVAADGGIPLERFEQLLEESMTELRAEIPDD